MLYSNLSQYTLANKIIVFNEARFTVTFIRTQQVKAYPVASLGTVV